jgi:AcrR family transcriptional regulator
MILVTLTFRVALLHGRNFYEDQAPPLTEEALGRILASVEGQVSGGLGCDPGRIGGLDYGALEMSIPPGQDVYQEEGRLLKAVAQVVAEAGPWNASMDMVARRSGLSKSGLYAHFKSKEDMIRQLFLTEFDRIGLYAELCTGDAAAREERLYLFVLAAVSYLRSNPEILIAMDWFRTRGDSSVQPPPLRIYQIAAGALGPEAGERTGMTGEQIAQWILFLIVNTLMRRPGGMDFAALPNESVRTLFRFITLGLDGFNL